MSTWLALRNLLRNPRRTAVTLATVAIGTAALFLFEGFNTGIMNQYRDNAVHARYGHGQVNTKGYRETIFEKPWEQWIGQAPAVLKTLSGLPDVTHVFPRVGFSGLLTNGRVSVAGHGMGVDGSMESDFFTTINIVQGEPLRATRDGIVLGIGLARTLDVKPGDKVTILANTIHGSMNGADLTVTGIFHAGTREMDDVLFQMQLPQAQTLLDSDKIETIALGLRGHDSWEGFARAAAHALPHLETTPFQILDKVYYQNAIDFLGAQFSVIQSIILFVVVLGVFSALSSAILERTQEIGMLRANGESVPDVLALLAWEGAWLAACGAALGVVSVIALSWTALRDGIAMPPGPGITRSFQVFVELGWGMAARTAGLVGAAALCGTLLAGVRVSRMPISHALRSTS